MCESSFLENCSHSTSIEPLCTAGVGQREGVEATTRKVLPVSVREEVSVSFMFSKSEMMDVIGCTSDHGSKRVVTR